MLSYQHTYHAGNFADVHKHLVLCRTLAALTRKPAALMVLDSHAGRGGYDLASEAAARTAEFRDGIARLWAASEPAPALADYLALVRRYNPDGRLRRYPGSPLLARALLRPQDRLVLCEQHPQEIAALRQLIGADRQVAIHQRDGWEALGALLPPRAKRGLVLIDPSYEVKSDYRQLVDALARVHQRWRQGRILVWYPLLPAGRHHELLRRLSQSGLRSILRNELQIRPAGDEHGLYGSGLLLVNPPWPLAEQLPALTTGLARLLAQGETRATTDWLVPE